MWTYNWSSFDQLKFGAGKRSFHNNLSFIFALAYNKEVSGKTEDLTDSRNRYTKIKQKNASVS